jgi:glutamate 5-kinase
VTLLQALVKIKKLGMKSPEFNSLVSDAKVIVVKVGSSLVTNNGNGLDHIAIAEWASQIATLVQQGKQVVLVSSGAVAEGMQRLGWKKRPVAVNELQAAAAVGQMGLVQMYERCFSQHQLHTAQVLLTHDDLADRKRYLNARTTLRTLLDLKVIPIINENDTVVTDEIKFGDNDTLGSLVANLIEADTLVILTDQQGLYSADPRKDPNAQFVQRATAGDLALEQMAGGAGSSVGTGGMLTKILAAKRAARSGAHTVIASGREHNVLVRLSAGELIGTHLEATQMKIAARKQWLADHLRTTGKVVLDDGAVRVLVAEGKSLLPIGVTAVEGYFERGDVVACVDVDGNEIARGLVNYSASETARVMRKPSQQIESILGYVDEAELIHRDNLVLLKAS